MRKDRRRARGRDGAWDCSPGRRVRVRLEVRPTRITSERRKSACAARKMTRIGGGDGERFCVTLCRTASSFNRTAAISLHEWRFVACDEYSSHDPVPPYGRNEYGSTTSGQVTGSVFAYGNPDSFRATHSLVSS